MKRVKQVEIDNTHYTLHQDNRRLVIFEQECLGGRPIANFCTQKNDICRAPAGALQISRHGFNSSR